jgi:hypothetical protein
MGIKLNTGTWIAVGIVVAGVVLGLVALTVRPPPPKDLPPASQPVRLTPPGS